MRDGHDQDQDLGEAPPARRRLRPTATTPVALTLGIGAFVLVAVLSVLAVGVWSGYRNTADLLRQKATLVVDAAIDRLALHLGAAEEQTLFVARSIAEGEVLRGDLDAFVPMLSGALAALPQTNALYFLDTEHRLTGVERDGEGIVPVFAGLALDPDMRQILAEAATHRTPYWAEMLWRDTFNALHVNLRTPVWRDGEFQGVVMALVSVPSLSLLIGNLESEFGYNAFILLDEQRVLAHPMLQFGFPGLTRWKPVPTLGELGDPVLNIMWSERRNEAPLAGLVAGPQGHTAKLGRDTYVFLYNEVEGFGPRPWLVGTYLRATGLTDEIDRLYAALVICGALLVAAVLVSGWLGASIARPARRLAVAADSAARLDDLPSPARPSPPPAELPGSGFRELDQAVRAFNAMRRRQHALNLHAPRHLVSCLEAAGHLGDRWADGRDVTVLAVAIPSPSAPQDPLAAAAGLGRLLEGVTEAVRASGGIVEHAGSTGVLAWWGGLEGGADHASRALLAAQDVAALDPALRLGLDSGRAVVATVSTGDRLTACVIGPPAPGAAALVGLNLAPIAATHDAVRAAGLNAVSLGHHPLNGDGTTREVFRVG